MFPLQGMKRCLFNEPPCQRMFSTLSKAFSTPQFKYYPLTQRPNMTAFYYDQIGHY